MKPAVERGVRKLTRLLRFLTLAGVGLDGIIAVRQPYSLRKAPLAMSFATQRLVCGWPE
jgi:hypothetical protein